MAAILPGKFDDGDFDAHCYASLMSVLPLMVGK